MIKEKVKFHIIDKICKEETKEGMLKLLNDCICFVTVNMEEDNSD